MLHIEFLTAWAKSHVASDRGASLVEYALLVALIAVICIGAVGLLGQSADDSLTEAGSAIGGV